MGKIENRKRCLACKHYGMNVCPFLANADVFQIDNCILDSKFITNLKDNSPEKFMWETFPIMYLMYINFQRRAELPKIGSKVVTLRPGFNGGSGETRIISDIDDKYIYLSNGGNAKSCSEINTWYRDFFEI